MIRAFRFFIAMAALAALVGCAADTGIRGFWTLRDTDFRKLKPGMNKANVVALVGRPQAAVTFARLGEEVWDYSYLDYQVHMRAYVYFDTKGLFTRHIESYDQDYYSTVAE
ncbi:MAG: outer membrane protein assembly factor BamE [Betaproteobacteria bacterium]|nr:outer membrane protein assembly factor BamE [Betaproteobacteria bacterium]MBI2958808.1 outer membrane protein assembly factor BamE [Betaproteobacteria bacterium]